MLIVKVGEDVNIELDTILPETQVPAKIDGSAIAERVWKRRLTELHGLRGLSLTERICPIDLVAGLKGAGHAFQVVEGADILKKQLKALPDIEGAMW
jgi:hypothetical protein